jgi:nucleotide-binding universal stress UspA family protein
VATAPKNVLSNQRVQLDRILVATDFSPVSTRALDYAVSLARRYESRVYLAHVISPDAYPLTAPEVTVRSMDKQLMEAKTKTQELLMSDRFHGIPYEVYIETGALWPVLDRIIKKYGIDLVVVGTHGMGAVKKVLIGSGAEQIFRQCPEPVLTVGPAVEDRYPTEREFKNILFATDFGLGAEREAAFAFSLGQEHDATVTLLYVVRHMDDYSEDGMALKREAIRNQLRELVPEQGDVWCQTQLRMRVGDPVEEILRVAEETSADLIVMGAKRRANLPGHVPGTKAYKVVTRSHCPVLTVRS